MPYPPDPPDWLVSGSKDTTLQGSSSPFDADDDGIIDADALPPESSIGTVTRDSAGQVTAFGATTDITRDATGRVTGFSENGTPRTVTRDSQGRVEAIA
jgi:YD repeat-containing protein